VRKRSTLILGVLTVISVLVGASTALAQELPPGGTFTDDDGNVHEGYIEALAAAGITDGCTVDRFCPDDLVTRGQMAAFLHRALPDLPTVVSRPSYIAADLSGSVFGEDMWWMWWTGLTQGCGTTTLDNHAGILFCPEDPVTRGQMAAFLVRAFDPERAIPPIEYDFVDDDDSIFEQDIEQLARARLTQGCNPGDTDPPRFCPDAPVTRGQMASLLGRAMGLTPTVPPPADS
jgi:hypothetical protein